MRRIGVLIGSAGDADDTDVQARLVAFQQGLQQLGWIDGRNVRIEYRRGAGDADRIRRFAAELVALAPEPVEAAKPQIAAEDGADAVGLGRIDRYLAILGVVA